MSFLGHVHHIEIQIATKSRSYFNLEQFQTHFDCEMLRAGLVCEQEDGGHEEGGSAEGEHKHEEQSWLAHGEGDLQ